MGMLGQDLKGWALGRWLGRMRLRSDLAWVIDQRDGERWVEFGRYASGGEAEAWVARLVSQGRSDPSTFRIARRPLVTEPPRALVWGLALGFVGCAILIAVLVVTQH